LILNLLSSGNRNVTSLHLVKGALIPHPNPNPKSQHVLVERKEKEERRERERKHDL
jgi:hypothetical protein